MSSNKDFGTIVLNDMLSAVNAHDLAKIRNKYLDTVKSIYKEIYNNMNNNEEYRAM